MNSERCSYVGWSVYILNISVFISIVWIFSIRTWAIYLGDWRILVALGTIGVACVSVNLTKYAAMTRYTVINFGFTSTCSSEQLSRINGLDRAWGFLNFIFDSAVFWLTFRKTIGVARQKKRQGMENSLIHWVLRDGIMYYVARIFLLTVSLLVVSIGRVPISVQRFIVITANTLTNIMVNHMMLNLRQMLDIGENGSHSENTLTMPTFTTNAIIGNIGAPIRLGVLDNDNWADTFSHTVTHSQCSDV
ncbi:hypothetical protein BD410DRAFT_786304 [Rickenella mellea]|uniref:Uncharacterized protein n=1 Tax=Rickenella mellea TaxID=50990 RepID=A0A4Y7QAF0_9AGAM|nr:hypothetical protein BD410DRAFT_786304 [Rickenella mellea]